jgi:hypothetical protein
MIDRLRGVEVTVEVQEPLNIELRRKWRCSFVPAHSEVRHLTNRLITKNNRNDLPTISMGLEAPRLLDYSIIQSGIHEAERYDGRGLQLM